MTRQRLEVVLVGSHAYVELFRRAYSSHPTIELACSALADYERSIVSGSSAFDRFEWLADESALSADALRGLRLFRGKARCTLCHVGTNFTDGGYHALGAGALDDRGRFEHTGQMADLYAFKTPSLRAVCETPPYMHDGSFATLRDVILFYNAGCRSAFTYLDHRIQPLGLSTDEQAQLESFLCALSGRITSLPAELMLGAQ